MPLFVYHACSTRTAGDFVFTSFHSAFPGFGEFQIFLAAILSFWEHRREAARTYLAECRRSPFICCIMEDQSTLKLILHQVSSIFLGSGSRGRCSPDTRKTVCTSRPRGGPYGKKHLHSLPASLLQRKCRDEDSDICIALHNQSLFTVVFTFFSWK